MSDGTQKCVAVFAAIDGNGCVGVGLNDQDLAIRQLQQNGGGGSGGVRVYYVHLNLPVPRIEQLNVVISAPVAMPSTAKA